MFNNKSTDNVSFAGSSLIKGRYEYCKKSHKMTDFPLEIYIYEEINDINGVFEDGKC